MRNFLRKLLWITILCLLFTVCSRDNSPYEPEEFTEYPKDRLLTDEELWTEEDPNALYEKPEWVRWIKEYHVPIRSLFCDDFSDLQFLKPLLQNKRIVQLGESGHGVAQFNQAKVRLIKFLHQECGFNVIAFESSIFACFYTNENMTSEPTTKMMLGSIFQVWHTWEVEPLYQYIKDCYDTNNPLVLTGFDVQPTHFAIWKRPEFLKNVISMIDSTYARTVHQFDSVYASIYRNDRNNFGAWIESNKDILIKDYESIVDFMDQHMDELQQVYPENIRIPLMARQTAWSIVQHIHQRAVTKAGDNKSGSEIRDKGMADNIDFLLDALYPGQKIIVWAHNTHIRHDNDNINIPPTYSYYGSNYIFQNMGSWLAQRHRPELYTIGLYMYRGQAAGNSRDVYDIQPATFRSLESILYRARKMYCYVDLSNETRNDGNSWMFENIDAKSWGCYALKMVLKDQYDGILFIDTVTPPDYIPADYFQSKTSGKVSQSRLKPFLMNNPGGE